MEHRSDKQIEASRANGAKSRGPVTPGGKDRSSANSFKHGRYAITTPLLRGEDSEAFQHHLHAFIARMQPADLVELAHRPQTRLRRLAPVSLRRHRGSRLRSGRRPSRVLLRRRTRGSVPRLHHPRPPPRRRFFQTPHIPRCSRKGPRPDLRIRPPPTRHSSKTVPIRRKSPGSCTIRRS